MRKNTSPEMSERIARIEERMASMETTTKDGFANMNAQLERVHACVDRVGQKMDAAVHGDRSSPGLIVRVDRLEQNGERSRWLMRAVIGAMVTVAVGALWAVLKAG